MPMYDYRCPKCGIVESVIHKITNDTKVLCIKCYGNGDTVEMTKLLSSNYTFKFLGKMGK